MATYFDCAINKETRKLVIEEALRHLGRMDFDTIAVRGVSGQAVGTILAYELDCNLFVIRKFNDDSHNGHHPAGHLGERVVIVDDFIATGNTMRQIMEKVSKSKVAGIYLYNADERMSLWDGIPVIAGQVYGDG